ncbi:MAG: PEP-CTERM sorting domain-containing protein [Phycisphaerales bacterium]
MRCTAPLAVIALAGLTTAASAQTKGTITLTILNVSENIYAVNVYADDVGAPGVFAFDIAIDLVGAGTLLTGPTQGGAYVFGFSGGLTPTGVEAVGGSTDIFGPTFDAPLNALLLFSFQFQHFGGFVGAIAHDGSGPNPALQTVTEGGIVLLPANYDEINFDSVSFPAPSSTALLGIGAILGARRRRR